MAPEQGFTITEGEDLLSTYVDKMTDTGNPLERTFCSLCGSNMFNFPSQFENIVSIAAGSLDDFESWKPTLEQYCLHRADFLEKMKGVENRYIESLNGEPEKE
jgi:hypothetical protein